MPLGMELCLGPGDFVLDGDPAPPPQKGGEAPRFSAQVYCQNVLMDQDGTWRGGRPRPGDFVLDGDPAPNPKKGRSPQSQKGAEPPTQFWPISIVAKGLDASRCHLVWR